MFFLLNFYFKTKILRSILSTDHDFVRILRKNDFLFLDRGNLKSLKLIVFIFYLLIFLIGFRDIVKELQNKFSVNTIIPHCKQNQTEEKDTNTKKETKKEQPLTAIESSQARLCTKIRSMVERMFSVIKQNYSLDYIRNTMIGHIAIDLRNLCAFYNFTFKPTFYDEPYTEDVSVRLKKKADENQTNNLQFLFRYRLSTSKIFSRIKLNEIDDFIKLKRKYLRRKIYCGSFHYKMSKSYLIDLVKFSKAYILQPNKKIAKQISDPRTKILGVTITSRYSRGKTKKPRSKKGAVAEEIDYFTKIHRVYIQYLPLMFLNKKERKADLMKGWICTCMNGKRLAGCCSHVATVIYFLSYARFKSNNKYPGEFLNAIFNDKRKTKNPRYYFY